MTAITLRIHQALGDAVCMTALVRDLKRQHPQYRVALDVNWRPVWDTNPYATVGADPHARRVEIGYTGGVTKSKNGQPVHLIRALCDDLEAKTGIAVEPEEPKGEILLKPAEKTSPVSGRYWVVVAGGKLDMTVKHWHTHRFQEVVDRLKAYGIDCVQAGAAAVGHIHPPLANCLSAVGKTENPRDLFRLIAHADGVICGVTSAGHIAACFDKPCVVLGGGREEPSFYGYTNVGLKDTFGPRCAPVAVEQKILHTVGLMHCCDRRGCWRKRTVAIDAKDVGRKDRLCLEPVRDAPHPVAKCLDLVSVDHVVESVLSYYADGTLPSLRREVRENVFQVQTTTAADLVQQRPEPAGRSLRVLPDV